jgi:hypothetical protein
MTWVFNRTGESLPLVMLLHASINTTYSLVWPQIFPTLNPYRDTLHAQFIASAAVAAVLIVATRGRLGRRPDRGSPRPEAQTYDDRGQAEVYGPVSPL